MPIRPLSRSEVRSIDAKAVAMGIPSLVLMENAGRGAAGWLGSRLKPDDRVVIACGPGNNGGDGAVVARHLDALGVSVRVLWFARPEKLSADASTQREILANCGFDQAIFSDEVAPDRLDSLFSDAAWLVDALLGTGLTRPVQGPLFEVISALNRSGRPILSLDLPSGLDADAGLPLGIAVRATATVTFVAPKLGFSAEGADAFTGAVHVAGIGVPRGMLEGFRTA